MNKPQGFDEALTFTGEFETLPLGGHVCVIKSVLVEKTRTGKEMLKIALDIYEGEHKGFYQRQFERKKESNPDAKWSCVYNQLTEGTSLPFFKGVLAAIEESNKGYKWNWDEKTLIGKLIGGVFGEEEYVAFDGSVKKATKCVQTKSVEQIRKGVEIPPLKKLPGNKAQPINNSYSNIQPVDDGYIPF